MISVNDPGGKGSDTSGKGDNRGIHRNDRDSSGGGGGSGGIEARSESARLKDSEGTQSGKDRVTVVEDKIEHTFEGVQRLRPVVNKEIGDAFDHLLDALEHFDGDW